MTKIAVSGSLSQRYGSADPDPDPYQNFTDPQHWSYHTEASYRRPAGLPGRPDRAGLGGACEQAPLHLFQLLTRQPLPAQPRKKKLRKISERR
jgi:hypothetical protein